ASEPSGAPDASLDASGAGEGQHCDASVGAPATHRQPHGSVQSSQLNCAGSGQSEATRGEPAMHLQPVADDAMPQKRSCGCSQSAGERAASRVPAQSPRLEQPKVGTKFDVAHASAGVPASPPLDPPSLDGSAEASAPAPDATISPEPQPEPTAAPITTTQ